MSKQTLVFSSAADLSLQNGMICIEKEEMSFPEFRSIEDVRMVLIDHHSVHVTIPLLNALSEANVAVVLCDERHYPKSMLMDLASNVRQTSVFSKQLEASLPLRKQIWKQIVERKIRNQAFLLDKLGLNSKGLPVLKALPLIEFF